MSMCPNCARWAPPDKETGYDVDALCGDCQADGWTEDADGSIQQDQVETPTTGAEEDTPTGSDACDGGFAENY